MEGNLLCLDKSRAFPMFFFWVPLCSFFLCCEQGTDGGCGGRRGGAGGGGGLIELTSVPPLCPTPLCFCISCGI